MPISALVLTLPNDATSRTKVLTSLGDHPNVTCGEPHAGLLPLTLDTQTVPEHDRCWRWVRDLPNVGPLDLIHVVFETESE